MGSLESDAKHGLKREPDSDLSIEDRLELLQQARDHALIAHHARAASCLVSPHRPQSSSALEPNLIRSPTSYVITRSDHLESNVDSWMESANHFDNTRGLRRDETVGVQQPSLAENHGTSMSFWYLLAMLPLVNLPQRGWCSPRNSIMVILNSVELFAAWLKEIVSHVRTQMSTVDMDQVLHGCFVIVMDIIFAMHVFVFLMFNLCQASF